MATNDYRSDGRWSSWPSCDACGRPVDMRGGIFTVDDEVTDGDEIPGFCLCLRADCRARRDLPVEGRRALYAKQDAENERARAEGRRPRMVEA